MYVHLIYNASLEGGATFQSMLTWHLSSWLIAHRCDIGVSNGNLSIYFIDKTLNTSISTNQNVIINVLGAHKMLPKCVNHDDYLTLIVL